MTSPDCFLAIDNGTQSVRAILFDADGAIVARAKIPIEPYFSTQPGYAEQHAEVYWNALCSACRTLFAESGVDPERVAGVGITTQRATLIPVDAAGNALRPAITWLDQRETEGLSPLRGPWPTVIKLVGQGEPVEHFRKQAECNWIAANEPAIWAQTHKLLLLSGYHTHKLTGRFVDSVGCQVGYLPIDFKKLDYAPPWDWMWQALAVRRDQLPDLVVPGSRLGTITHEASRATGIPEGTEVIAAGADKACEVLGSGCLEPDVGCVSYGTTATINAANRRYVESAWMIPPYPAAVPNAYNTEIQIFRGFWMVEWWKREFAEADVARAAARGVPVETLFDESIATIPPGSMGLTLQPYWTPGLRHPGREGKGAIIGFGDVHTRAHVYRAILEGLAYALREGKERIEKKTRVPMRALRVSGGGSQSAMAMQITADVFGLPAERPHTFETSALGAAMCVAVGLGVHRDFPTAVARMTRTRDVFLPRADARATYDALYREVYGPMYARLRPLYQAIRKITGYPR